MVRQRAKIGCGRHGAGSGKSKVKVTILAELEKGFNKGKLRNGVMEPLRGQI